MISKESEKVSFEIILYAGNARSKAMEAISNARTGCFDDAMNCLNEAKEELRQVHLVQTKLIQDEASGKTTDLNVLLVHAQDHFAMAMATIDNAEEFISLYRRLSSLENSR